jgi:hypothetical protein
MILFYCYKYIDIMISRYQLIEPFVGNTLYETSSLKKGAQKCYNDIMNSNKSDAKIFTVREIGSGETFSFNIHKVTKNNNNQFGGDGANENGVKNVKYNRDVNRIRNEQIKNKIEEREDAIEENRERRREEREDRREDRREEKNNNEIISKFTNIISKLENKLDKLENKIDVLQEQEKTNTIVKNNHREDNKEEDDKKNHKEDEEDEEDDDDREDEEDNDNGYTYKNNNCNKGNTDKCTIM